MGTAALATTQKENRLAHPASEFSTEQIRLLAETVAKGCDQNELAFFLQVAKLKRLDPFTGQIHVVKRWDSSAGREKIVIQTGIDGYRAIASRTEDLAGIDDPEYDTDVDEHPNWAKITVYRYGRGDEKIPYRATARWGEYVQTYKDKQTGEVKPNPMWKRMPYLMLGKVAEALALRKAFPDELSGMYSDEEMGQADNEQPGAPAGKPQVQMPRSTDEKKAEPPKAAPQAGKAETVKQNPPAAQQGALQGQPMEISGEITDAKPGTGKAEGVLFLIVDKKIVSVPKSLIDAEMVAGAKVVLTVTKRTAGQTDQYMTSEVKMVVPAVVEGEIIDAEYAEVEEKPAEDKPKGTDPVLDEARAAGLGGIFDDAPPKKREASPAAQTAPAGEATKPGTAGVKRAQRLHALITQNGKNTGFTENHLEKYLSSLGLQHARDLPCPPKGSDAFNAYEFACAMAVGEEDWTQIVNIE